MGKFKRTHLAKPIIDSSTQLDVIFLDIQMPNETGLEFLKNNTIKHNVVFTTAYSEYAVESYNYNVIDYLLKPIQEERFEIALQKIKETINVKDKAVAYTKIDHLENNFIILKSGAETYKVLFNDLILLQSESEYIKYYTHQKQYLFLGSLKSIIKELPTHFIQVHRSYIINSTKIKARLNNYIVMDNETKIPIGKTHRKLVLNLLKKRGF